MPDPCMAVEEIPVVLSDEISAGHTGTHLLT
jgi:hypothetical protein